MRIIHIALGKANPARMNGVGVAIHNLATAQARGGDAVRFWGIARSFEELDYPSRPFETELFEQPTNRWALPKGLAERLRTVPKGTIFHLHGGLLPVMWRIGRLLRARGFEYACTPHGVFTVGAFENGFWRKTLYLQTLERDLFRGSIGALLLSAGERNFLEKKLPSIRSTVVPNAYELLVDRWEMSKKPLPERLLFVFCGRISWHHKGLDILLDGFAKYREEGGKGRLRMIGDGPDRVHLQMRTHDLGIADEVEWTGALFNDEKRTAIAEGQVFLHPSRNEGLPVAPLEAAALGLPLLVSESSNVGGYVRRWNAGWVLAQNDPRHLSIAFFEAEMAWQTVFLKQMQGCALDMIEGDFAPERIAAAVGDFYRKRAFSTAIPEPFDCSPLDAQPISANETV